MRICQQSTQGVKETTRKYSKMEKAHPENVIPDPSKTHQEWFTRSVICLTKCTFFLGQAHQVNLCTYYIGNGFKHYFHKKYSCA